MLIMKSDCNQMTGRCTKYCFLSELHHKNIKGKLLGYTSHQKSKTRLSNLLLQPYTQQMSSYYTKFRRVHLI